MSRYVILTGLTITNVKYIYCVFVCFLIVLKRWSWIFSFLLFYPVLLLPLPEFWDLCMCWNRGGKKNTFEFPTYEDLHFMKIGINAKQRKGVIYKSSFQILPDISLELHDIYLFIYFFHKTEIVNNTFTPLELYEFLRLKLCVTHIQGWKIVFWFWYLISLHWISGNHTNEKPMCSWEIKSDVYRQKWLLKFFELSSFFEVRLDFFDFLSEKPVSSKITEL